MHECSKALNLITTDNKSFMREGPDIKQSFKLGLSRHCLAEQSYTNLNGVVTEFLTIR